MEGYNLTEVGTTSSFSKPDKTEHNVLDAILEYRRLEDAEAADLDLGVAAVLAFNRPLGSRTWFAVHAAGYPGARLGPERSERIAAAASFGFKDEERDGRMRAVRSVLRQSVVTDPATDAAIAAELGRPAPGVPGLIARWCACDRRGRGGAR